MTDTATKPTKSNAEIVLSAVQDLFAREQIVTRETLAELTDLDDDTAAAVAGIGARRSVRCENQSGARRAHAGFV